MSDDDTRRLWFDAMGQAYRVGQAPLPLRIGPAYHAFAPSALIEAASGIRPLCRSSDLARAAGHSGSVREVGEWVGENPRSPTTWQQVPIYGDAAAYHTTPIPGARLRCARETVPSNRHPMETTCPIHFWP